MEIGLGFRNVIIEGDARSIIKKLQIDQDDRRNEKRESHLSGRRSLILQLQKRSMKKIVKSYSVEKPRC
ncbi:hypothetical protein PVK06_019400 [Gossypium arboreum]|uniref:Uncharacterized protein n=1 Tax=Gossypium arboreum TaxID=29729 RepID=A0ABR0PK29_GOSAR|nr:hypothetical protein PVK06_019400 [Gossypium arboreum]